MNFRIWTILGIEATKDIKKIKQAYASASKKYHPEEYPEEFKRLQNAYKEAMKYAKSEEPEPINESAVRTASDVYEVKPVEVTVPPIKLKDNFIADAELEEVAEDVTVEMEEVTEEPEAADIPIVKTEMFNYEEILSNPDEDLFWRQLGFICWHPYIRNHYDYWNYFLKQPDVLERMKNDDFRNRFKDRMKQENILWEKHILKYFDDYFNKFISPESNEIKNWASQKLKPNILHNFFGRTQKGFETKNEEQTYNVLWFNLKQEVRQNPEVYLKQYFTYAEINYDKLKEIHREAHAVRKNRPVIRILIFIFIVIVVAHGIYTELQVEKIKQKYSSSTTTYDDLVAPTVSGPNAYEMMVSNYKEDEHFMALVEEYAPSCIDEEAILTSLYTLIKDREDLLIEQLKTLEEARSGNTE